MIYFNYLLLTFNYKKICKFAFLGENSNKLATLFLAFGPRFIAVRELAKDELYFILFWKIYRRGEIFTVRGEKSRRAGTCPGLVPI
jgi:hypothetical protein